MYDNAEEFKMNVEQVLNMMLEMCPQLLPIIDGCNPENQVIMADGAIIETYDTVRDKERTWKMVDLNRKYVFRDVKTEDELRKAIATYIPTAALREIQAGYDPAIPPVVGNYFYILMSHACWQMKEINDQQERRRYAGKLLDSLNRIAPEKFATAPQKYFDAFKLGM
jgi:hypothetical protein